MRPRPSHPEIKVCGYAAVRALFERRAEDIVRVYVLDARVKEVGPLLKWCADAKKAYHIVDEAELDRVADTIHHEGLCVLARAKRHPTLDELAAALRRERGPACVLVLDDVRNPHNLGAILRTAAHFGVRAVLVHRGDEEGALFTPGLYRTAEGGAESVDVVLVDDPAQAVELLGELRFTVLATSSHARRSIYALELPARVAYLMGAEGEGLSRQALQAADELITIPGTGEVESLNVSAATAVLTSEHWRRHRTAGEGAEVRGPAPEGVDGPTEPRPGGRPAPRGARRPEPRRRR